MLGQGSKNIQYKCRLVEMHLNLNRSSTKIITNIYRIIQELCGNQKPKPIIDTKEAQKNANIKVKKTINSQGKKKKEERKSNCKINQKTINKMTQNMCITNHFKFLNGLNFLTERHRTVEY